jgi:hypothetical protein
MAVVTCDAPNQKTKQGNGDACVCDEGIPDHMLAAAHETSS